MGVVRREGDWRLEKQGEGLYEITYDREPQMNVITPEYSSDMLNDRSRSALPVREVNSSAAAEELFKEQAHCGIPPRTASVGSHEPVAGLGDDVNPGLDMSDSGNEGLGPGGGGETEGGDGNPPTGLLAIALIAAGAIIVAVGRTSPGEPIFLFGAGIAVLGVLIFGWAAIIYLTRGGSEAVEFLVPVERNDVISKEGAVIGGATGFVGTLLMHIMGVPEQAMIHDSLAYLFETAPLAGYILFTTLGIFLGAFRLVP